MKEIDHYYTCFASGDQRCHQPDKRAQLCALNLDGGDDGCHIARMWIKKQIASENVGIKGSVRLFVSDDQSTLRGELRDEFTNKAYVVSGGIVRSEDLPN